MTRGVGPADGPDENRLPTSASNAASAHDPGAGCTLEVIGITKSYGATVVVDTVNLNVPPGRLLTLLGPSGCGKTTILMSIAGFVQPSAGDIRIDGRSILNEPPEKRGTAMLFQQYALFPHMSVQENVAFGLKMRGYAKKRIVSEVETALRITQVEGFAERYPSQLSGGQKQRVALARAIVTHPKVLLLDEPFGALDQNLREAMQVELRKLQQRLGITSVIVTHDQKEAILLSDMIAVMNAGRIEQIGSPIEIYDRPRTRFAASFTGVDNILPVSVLRRSGDLVDVSLAGTAIQQLALPASAGSSELCAAIRAESVGIAPATSATQGAIGGSVTFARVLGPAVLYEVSIVGGMVVKVAAPRQGGALFAPGDQVRLTLPASRCALVIAE